MLAVSIPLDVEPVSPQLDEKNVCCVKGDGFVPKGEVGDPSCKKISYRDLIVWLEKT